ncbi:MAG: hypothetical protein J6Y69_10585 [Treponema sp.]|nr:hypothetical protein [Treponema sp.]
MIFQYRLNSDQIEPDYPELYRYAGFAKKSIDQLTDMQMKELAQSAVEAVSQKMNCRSVYSRFQMELLPCDIVSFAGKSLQTHHLTLNLKDCHSVYMFAATLGPEVDRIIQRETRINPAKAVMMQAAGAMFIEKYCDMFVEFLRTEEATQGNLLKPRYSPGFGDVGLEVQKTFFELLECQKNLALTLNDTLIMSPEKSVTAFIGVYDKENA